MGIKKYVQLTALAAALTVSSMTVCAAEPAATAIEESEVAKDDSVYAGLDSIIAQMQALYNSGDCAGMYALDTADTTKAYVQMIKDAGADRYICSLGDAYGMLYVSSNGGWSWYFGEMQGNLRQGTGTTVICNDGYNEVYTGEYAGDVPYGQGTYQSVTAGVGVISIAGIYQGAVLNGTYTLEVNDLQTGHKESVQHNYVNGHLPKTNFDVHSSEGKTYHFYRNITDANELMVEDVYLEDPYNSESACIFVGYEEDNDVVLGEGRELLGIAYIVSDDAWWWLTKSSEELDSGLLVLRGNPNGVAVNAEITTAPVVETEATVETPATVETEAAASEQAVEQEAVPEQTVTTETPSTYTVERGDNLCKIAKKLYGSEKYYKNIYDANADVIKDDYVIYATQVLVIPSV